MADHAVTVDRGECVGTTLYLCVTAFGQLLVGNVEVDRAIRDVEGDHVAVFDERYKATVGSFWRDVPNRQARRSTREATIGKERTLGTEAAALDVGGRVEHLLHSRTTLRALVADDDDLAALNFFEHAFHSVLLRFVDAGGAGELPDRLVDTCGLHDAAIFGQVAEQHCQAAFGRIRVFGRTDAAVFTIVVDGVPTSCLTKRNLRRNSSRACTPELLDLLRRVERDVPFGEGFVPVLRVNKRR